MRYDMYPWHAAMLVVLLFSHACALIGEKGGKQNLKFEVKQAFAGKTSMGVLGDSKIMELPKPGVVGIDPPPVEMQPEEPMFSVQTEPPAFEQQELIPKKTASPASPAPVHATAAPQSRSPTSLAPVSSAPSTSSPVTASPSTSSPTNTMPPTTAPSIADIPGSQSDSSNGEQDETAVDSPSTSQATYAGGTTMIGIAVLVGLLLFLVIVFVLRRRRNGTLNEKEIYDEILQCGDSPDRSKTGKSYGTMHEPSSTTEAIARSPQYDAMPFVLPDSRNSYRRSEQSTYAIAGDADAAVMPELTSASDIVLAELDANGAALASRRVVSESGGGGPMDPSYACVADAATITTTTHGSDSGRVLRRRGRSPVKNGNDAANVVSTDAVAPLDTPVRSHIPPPPPRDYTPQLHTSGGTKSTPVTTVTLSQANPTRASIAGQRKAELPTRDYRAQGAPRVTPSDLVLGLLLTENDSDVRRAPQEAGSDTTDESAYDDISLADGNNSNVTVTEAHVSVFGNFSQRLMQLVAGRDADPTAGSASC